MYFIHYRTYLWRECLDISSKEFTIFSDSLMNRILKEKKIKSVKNFIKWFNETTERDPKLRKQIITSATKINIQKRFPFIKITKITAS